MATVIDALVMTLGLDVADFNKNEKDANERLNKFKKESNAVAKDVADGGKRMAEGFAFVKRELLGVLAALGATMGIKEFISSNVQGQAALGRLSRNLQISARDLEAWGLVAKEMGGQAEDAFGALQNVATGLAEASIKGHSALTDLARANGIDLAGVKNSEDALIRISARLSQLPRQQAQFLANQLGVGSMYNQLMLGPEALQRRLEAARGLSRVTEESTAAAERLQARWADIQQRFKETSEIAFSKLSPALERMATQFTQWLDSVDWDKVGKGIEKLASYAKSFADEIASARKDINSIDWGPLGDVLKTAVEHARQFLGYVEKIRDFGTGVRHKVGQWAADHANDPAVAAPGSVASRFMKWLAGKNNIPVKPASASVSRGIRNNNPGNLNYAGQRGAHLEAGPNGRFAVFGTQDEGIAALAAQLGLYAKRGNDTIAGIVNQYAPASDGNDVSAYIADLTRSTGRKANEHLNLNDPSVLVPLMQAIIRHEGNGSFSQAKIMRGITVGAGTTAALRGNVRGSTSTSTAEVHIGKIDVNTQATDARGIARDLGHAIQNQGMVALADTGIQ